jgi:hypothetical protein
LSGGVDAETASASAIGAVVVIDVVVGSVVAAPSDAACARDLRASDGSETSGTSDASTAVTPQICLMYLTAVSALRVPVIFPTLYSSSLVCLSLSLSRLFVSVSPVFMRLRLDG